MTAGDLTMLRRLQYAANMLSYHEFCDALGWDRDDYSKHKFQDFQTFGKLGSFDSNTLRRAIEFYEDKQ